MAPMLLVLASVLALPHLAESLASPLAMPHANLASKIEIKKDTKETRGRGTLPSPLPVWIWWEWTEALPTGYRMNLESWRKHAPSDKFQLHFLNQSNIHEYMPDMPKWFFKLYRVAQSDFVRSSLIANHGGVYFDGDFVLMQDLAVTLKPLLDGKVDTLTYLSGAKASKDHKPQALPDVDVNEVQKCPNRFSTNFFAGRKGNALSVEWVKNVTARMGDRCKYFDKVWDEEKTNGVCCFHPDGTERKECHIPFGAIGDASAFRANETLYREHSAAALDLRQGCINHEHGFAPTMTGQMYWRPLVAEPIDMVKMNQTKPERYTELKDKTQELCWLEGETSLNCTASGAFPGFFARHGLHLFGCINGWALKQYKTNEELLTSGTVGAEIFRVALKNDKKTRSFTDRKTLKLDF